MFMQTFIYFFITAISHTNFEQEVIYDNGCSTRTSESIE